MTPVGQWRERARRSPGWACVAIAIVALAACGGSSTGDQESAAPRREQSITTLLPSGEARWRSAPGTDARECVDVETLRLAGAGRRVGPNAQDVVLDVRSGDFLAGNFALWSGTGRPGGPDFRAKIYWVPRDPVIAKQAVVTVTVERVDVPGFDPLVQSFGGDNTWAMTPDGAFWPSGTAIPGRGRWKLTAEAPGHWGCFIVVL